MPSSGSLNSLWQKPVGPALAGAASVVSLFHRLPFRVSYADEASYSAITTYSFAIGGKPFIDELGVFQNAGILLTPFFRAYIAIVGSGDGLRAWRTSAACWRALGDAASDGARLW